MGVSQEQEVQLYGGARSFGRSIFINSTKPLKTISRARFNLASVINMCWIGNFDAAYITALYFKVAQKLASDVDNVHIFHEMEKFLRKKFNVDMVDLISEEKAKEILPVLSETKDFGSEAILKGLQSYKENFSGTEIS